MQITSRTPETRNDDDNSDGTTSTSVTAQGPRRSAAPQAGHWLDESVLAVRRADQLSARVTSELCA